MSETYPTNADLHREYLRLLADHRETMVRLRDLRDEFRAFKEHVAANLASLNELTAELLARMAEDQEVAKVPVLALRALTWNLGQHWQGDPPPAGWDPAGEYHQLIGETEADKPAPAVTVCGCCTDNACECEGTALRPDGLAGTAANGEPESAAGKYLASPDYARGYEQARRDIPANLLRRIKQVELPDG